MQLIPLKWARRFFQSCSSFESTVYPTNLQALLYASKVVRTPYMAPSGLMQLIDLECCRGNCRADPTLTATITDTRYSARNGTEPTQAINKQNTISIPPWMSGASALPMAATDGSFNSTTENVTATINTTGLSQGRHILFLRGKDQNGNWGAVSAIFLTVLRSDNIPP